jgi:hypothetical protein
MAPSSQMSSGTAQRGDQSSGVLGKRQRFSTEDQDEDDLTNIKQAPMLKIDPAGELSQSATVVNPQPTVDGGAVFASDEEHCYL